MTDPIHMSPERILTRLRKRGIVAEIVETNTLMQCRITHPVNGRSYPIRCRADLEALTIELRYVPAEQAA